MSNPESGSNPTETAPVFAALGDPTRLELVSRLSDGRSRCISELTRGLTLTRQGVTKHLRMLEHAGIVTSRRVGRENRFVLTPAPIAAVRNYLDDVSRQWDEALARLRAFVEEE